MSLIIIFANISLSLYGQNNAEEEFVKGLNYFYGKNGASQDYNQAYKSFLYSAKLEMPEAQFLVSFCYLNGLGIVENETEAFNWILKASKQDLPDALYWIGKYYIYGWGCPVDEKKGVENLLQAANKGVVEAQDMLGGCYMEAIGVEKDERKGFKWKLKAAEKGLAIAQNSVGWYYATGQGTEIDYKKALEWYEKSAAQDEAWAFNNMAYLYFEGKGVNKNIDKAFELVNKAIELGPENIQFYDSKGEFYSILGDKEKALAIWNKMLTINAESINAETEFAQYIQSLNIDIKKEIESNEWQIEPRFDHAHKFVENLALVEVNGRYGFINKQGTFIVEPKFDYARDFKDGFALIGKGIQNKIVWGFINDFGKIILEPLYIGMQDFSEGMVAYKSSLSEKWGFLDEKGKQVIPDKYIEVSSFKDGLALVDDGLNKGLINKKGIFIAKYSLYEYNSLKLEYVKESRSTNVVDIDYFPIYTGYKWGYKRISLDGYINSNLEKWEMFLSARLKRLDVYEEYLKDHIEAAINQWQQKGEFEPTVKWKERVNETTRRQKISELTTQYRKEYEDKLSTYKKRHAELVEEYKKEYNKYRDEYYTQKTYLKEENFKNSNFILMTYDADNQSFMIKSDNGQGDILISVPLEEAPSFKQNWLAIMQTITPTFVPSGDDVVLTSVTVTNGDKKYVYDSHTQAKYAVTDINYNFDPVEISIPEVANVDYTFDPVEVIQSTVVQTTPTVKGLEANNSAVERKTIDATQQSDVDMNIPQNAMDKNSNTFAVIIANEDYQRVSDVQYASNDGKLFSVYCQKTLGLPQKHIMVYNDATLGNMLGAVSRMKEIGEAYNGKINVIFYYAGHGIPDETSKDAFLLPVDSDGSSVRTCYKQSELYAELASIKAESVVVFMDACFSGTLRGDGMLVAARGVAIKAKKTNPIGNMVVFSAAQGDETAYPYKEQRHGMFTYYLLKKLQETKGEATLGEISDYVTSEVRKQSIVINGKMQTPTLTSSSVIGDAWRNWKLK